MNYKQSFIFLLLVQTLYFTPVLFKGEVIFAHDNGYEVASNQLSDSSYISNRKFSDQSSVYIPEINQHLNGNHRAWISTWNPYVQLGRPTFQISGFSKAYLITNILSLFTKNPFTLYTALTVITVFLTGIFLFLFLKSLNLHPLACSISAIGLSLGTFVSYWLTFIMFISTICWSVCLLWLNTEFIRKPSFLTALGISFATYSLLMTGYPQFVVLCAYAIIPYALITIGKHSGSVRYKFFIALMILGLTGSGLTMVLPTYADLFINAQRSARLSSVTDDFFLAVLPKIQNIKDLGIFLASIVDPFWLGNPIQQDYPVIFNGLSLNPLYSILFLGSFLNKNWRKLWFWQLFTIICLIGTLMPSVYLFTVHHLGFHFSRLQLLSGAIIPAFILCGFTVDCFIKKQLDKLINLVSLLFFTLVYFSTNLPLLLSEQSLGLVIASLLISGYSIGFIYNKKIFLLQCLVVVSVLIYGQAMMLVRPIDEIQTSSALINLIKEKTTDNSRFALVGNEMVGILPPNQEALFKIRSINSYDSLSSDNYQQIVQKWSNTGTNTYGRHFDHLDSEYKISSADFELSGVSLLVSKKELDEQQFVKVSDINDVKIYKTLNNPILISQFLFDQIEKDAVTINPLLKEGVQLNSEETVIFDDFLKIKVTSSNQKTLLFLSQQYHPQWKASSKNGLLKTILINDFYQGVIIPPNTEEVNLEFTPYVLWSWLPQLVYVSLGAGLIGIQLIKSTREVDTLLQ